MGLTALRNKRGIQAKPAKRPGGNDPSTLNRNPKPGAGQISGGADGVMAPRYQKMLDDGVDPAVVAARQKAYQSGQLPGQQQAQPGQGSIQADRPLLPNGQPMGGGAPTPSGQTPGIVPPMAKPAALPNGRFPVNPGGNVLPSGRPMQNMIANEPIQGGTGALSPAAWGALGGIRPMIPNEAGGNVPGGPPPLPTGPPGTWSPDQVQTALRAAAAARGAGGASAPVLSTGQPMGGFQSGPMSGVPYGNDAQARPMGGGPGLRSMSAGVPQAPPGGVGAPEAPDVQSLNGGGLQSGPPAGGGFAGNPGDPQGRQQAIIRGIAGRMAAGSAFNQ